MWSRPHPTVSLFLSDLKSRWSVFLRFFANAQNDRTSPDLSFRTSGRNLLQQTCDFQFCRLLIHQAGSKGRPPLSFRRGFGGTHRKGKKVFVLLTAKCFCEVSKLPSEGSLSEPKKKHISSQIRKLPPMSFGYFPTSESNSHAA